jgi:hypothetical protein
MPSLQIKNRIIGKDITAFKSWLSNNPINVIYPLRIPIEEELTAEHAQALKELATYYPVTNISIGSEQLDGYTVFNYPVSMKNGLDYVKKPIFTNYIPVKKNTQYVYGLSTENQLPAHKIRYFNSDGTYLKEVELSNASQNGLKTITFDDDYSIQLTFPDGLTDENKKNFKFKEENNMAVKAGNQITLVDITDAYSVMLTSEAYTFVGGTGGVGANQSCTTEAVAFCGNNQCSVVTVDAKSIVCPTGISAAVSNSGTSKVTIKFTTTATVNAACEATIPVSVDGITINKKFSFAVARTGNTGATGKGIKGTPVTEYVASTGKQGNTGAAGADAITVSITSSNGTVFKNNSGSTVLTAHVYKGAVEQTVADNGTVSGLGTIKWYTVGSDTAVATAKTLTVSANDVDNTQAYTCQLEG